MAGGSVEQVELRFPPRRVPQQGRPQEMTGGDDKRV